MGVIFRLAILFLLINSGCTTNRMAVPITNKISLEVLSGTKVDHNGYSIPKGMFLAFYAPSADDPYFNLELDSDYLPPIKILATNDLIYKENTDEDWDIRIDRVDVANKNIVYSSKNGKKGISVVIKLPLQVRPYSYLAYESLSGNEILLFGDISNECKYNKNKGFFAYFVINNLNK